MQKIPRYRQIAASIKNNISTGKYLPEQPLPTEARLREEFSVSRVTIRQAIKLLVDEGILESIQGSGTYVRRKKVDYNIYHMTSLAEKLEQDVNSHSDVLIFEITYPSEDIATLLDIGMKERIYYVKRVRYIEETAVTLEHTWMPLALFPDLTFQIMQGSKYQFMEQEKGMIIDYSEQEIEPVLPNQETIDHLKLEPNQPILMKTTRSFLLDGTAFEVSRNYFKSSDYKFTLIAKRIGRYQG